MNRKKLSLRMKITFINTIVLIFCSIILTMAIFLSAEKTIDSISTFSSKNFPASTQFVPSEQLLPSWDADIKPSLADKAEIITEATKVEKQSLRENILFYMLLVIILGGAITYFITGKSLKSLRELKDEIKDISEHNLSKKIEAKGADDEIMALTKSFNSMLGRIDDAFEEQKRFSVNVAHELRTPLAVIRMKIDVFKKVKNRDIDDYEKIINVIEKNNNRLSSIVEELLTICNHEKIKINEKINLNKIIDSISSELNEVANKKNITIFKEMNINSDKIFLGNEQLIYRAVYNLVENSIKYNNENGEIRIKVNNDNNFFNIVIEDTGIGIKEVDYESIFKPFYRVDKSRSRKIGGSGLGLSIVSNIVRQHNGSIKVTSDNYGSEFLIQIPCS